MLNADKKTELVPPGLSRSEARWAKTAVRVARKRGVDLPLSQAAVLSTMSRSMLPPPPRPGAWALGTWS